MRTRRVFTPAGAGCMGRPASMCGKWRSCCRRSRCSIRCWWITRWSGAAHGRVCVCTRGITAEEAQLAYYKLARAVLCFLHAVSPPAHPDCLDDRAGGGVFWTILPISIVTNSLTDIPAQNNYSGITKESDLNIIQPSDNGALEENIANIWEIFTMSKRRI